VCQRREKFVLALIGSDQGRFGGTALLSFVA
jgi:hypothetical protein